MTSRRMPPPRVLRGERGGHALAPLGRGHLATVHPDDRQFFAALAAEVARDARQEQPGGEVAAGAEDE